MKVPRSRRRGKSRIFRVNSFRAVAKARLINSEDSMNAKIVGFLHDLYRTVPLMELKFENGEKAFLPSFTGAYEGQLITYMKSDSVKDGSILRLKDMPPGTNVYNIELRPNDGGKMVRSGGGSAKIMEVNADRVTVALPSTHIISLDPNCRAIVGRVANGGRVEKPFYKAGNVYHMIRARGRYWPMNAAVAMNAYEHKFGGKRRSTQHKSKSVSRHASPGAKVGTIAPKRTGIR
jgi:large subunit ribosomal protein L2